jgi:hypothetical protein
MRNTYHIIIENLNRIDYLEYLQTGERIILKWIGKGIKDVN